MRCALAAKGFINGNVQHNKNVMLDTLRACSGRADIVIFGEAFLQGFDGAAFEPVHDALIAVTPDDPVIRELCGAAGQSNVALSFGFIEKEGDRFYSAQLTVSRDGRVIDLYRRISPGWKEPFANAQYCEGDGFHAFSFMGRQIAVGLCGDLWYDDHVAAMQRLGPDVVLWPVYTDFTPDEWNASEKHAYAAQAGRFCPRVLYVNSCCLDKCGDGCAMAGAALFENGRIAREVPAGAEAILFVDL